MNPHHLTEAPPPPHAPYHSPRIMPAIRAVSHVSLSLRDLEGGAASYREVLGLEVLAPLFEREAYRETMLRLPGGRQACQAAARSACKPRGVTAGLESPELHSHIISL